MLRREKAKVRKPRAGKRFCLDNNLVGEESKETSLSRSSQRIVHNCKNKTILRRIMVGVYVVINQDTGDKNIQVYSHPDI